MAYPIKLGKSPPKYDNSPNSLLSGKKKEPKPKLFGPDIFGWDRGLRREGGAKKFGMSFETQGNQTFWRDIPGFFQDIPGAPEKFERKKVCVQFSSPIFSGYFPTLELFFPIFPGRSKPISGLSFSYFGPEARDPPLQQAGMFAILNLRKILAPIKIKSALPTLPQKTKIPPPPKRGIFLGMEGFLQKERNFSRRP